MSKKRGPDFFENLWETAYNGHNRFCAVSIKTTGSDSKKHELVQICCFPLNANFELAKNVLPFYSDLRPLKQEEYDPRFIRLERYKEVCECSQLPQIVAELFDSWMTKIGLQDGKKLLPICYNWAFTRSFIKNWLGSINFNEYFSQSYRDIWSIALFLNDHADRLNLDVPYLKTTLTTLSKTLHIEYKKHDECILQCKTISEVYIALMKNM
jgi:hypothetical protein